MFKNAIVNGRHFNIVHMKNQFQPRIESKDISNNDLKNNLEALNPQFEGVFILLSEANESTYQTVQKSIRELAFTYVTPCCKE